MNCEKCQELLSDFLDGTLTGEERVLLGRHVTDCLACAAVRDDLGAIVSSAQAAHNYSYAPPNSRALWLRISNTLEAERAAQQQAAARVAALAADRRESFVARTLQRRWTLTLPQLSAAVAALVVAVATVTVFSVQSMLRPQSPPDIKVAAAGGPAHRTINDQELDLLMQRIEQRKARWNPRMRDAFERNIVVIDAAVNDSLQQLDQSPHDEVSEEALDAAMRDKKELLRQFAEL